MKKAILFILLPTLLFAQDFAKHVNPFIGTGGAHGFWWLVSWLVDVYIAFASSTAVAVGIGVATGTAAARA